MKLRWALALGACCMAAVLSGCGVPPKTGLTSNWDVQQPVTDSWGLSKTCDSGRAVYVHTEPRGIAIAVVDHAPECAESVTGRPR